jgi:hypothetical protein
MIYLLSVLFFSKDTITDITITSIIFYFFVVFYYDICRYK